ncbi:HAD-like domain-containing protein [Epithele typhae]|uniref:HAD-like domain-containing protein n=1 Tax=Epithele typhae TaxID=378194 RepID=UPI002007C0B2|nr:HAD-like domain-containing protein [Epithele typhae]KAH9913466.1 HAD-like domain-containing protein [Epithele typhae]
MASAPSPGPRHRSSPAPLPPLVFTFDIDGVLIRGAQIIPAARKAFDMLNGNNPMGVKIPYILLTNGGGVGEEARRLKLSKQLGVDLDVDQIVQAHTMLKSIAHKYADKPVLVLGGRTDVVRKVAESYGFKHAYTTLDVLAWKPEAWPFHELTPEERASTQSVDFSTTPLSAIFVFHDPRNWSLDIQISLDVLLSHGLIGNTHLLRGASPPAIDMVFCNPDLLWKNEFPVPRLGQGAFRDAFQAVHTAVTGAKYPHVVQYGKPTRATYAFATRVLYDRLAALQGGRALAQEQLPRVYMVGDNPESAPDIAGANGAGWESVLVETGVYDPAEGPPAHVPTHIATNVASAVQWAIEREMSAAQ